MGNSIKSGGDRFGVAQRNAEQTVERINELIGKTVAVVNVVNDQDRGGVSITIDGNVMRQYGANDSDHLLEILERKNN